MPNRLLKTLLLLTAIAAAAGGLGFESPVYGQNDLGRFLGRRIVRIDINVEGAPNVNTTDIRDLLEVGVGQVYSQVQINRSLLKLFQSGLISAGKVEAAAEGAEGVALTFIVRPQTRIENITFSGSPGFSESELKGHLNQMEPGQKLNPAVVSRGAQDLQSFYAAHGFYQARITSEVSVDPTATRATVSYAINPGEAAVVGEIRLKKIGEEPDLSAVKPGLVKGKPFTQSDLQEEVDRLRQAYLAQDFLSAKVSGKSIPDPARNAVDVEITAESGPRVMVKVQGLDLPLKTYRKVLPFYNQGGVDDFTLEEARRNLVDYAQKQGYFFAAVEKPELPDLNKPRAVMTFKVAPGKRYRLAEIRISGLDALPVAQLIDEMKSQPSALISFTSPRRGITSDDLLRQDVNLIRKRLNEQGYRNSRVEALRGVTVDGKKILIDFKVNQGPRTYVDEVGIRGNNMLSRDQLESSMTLKPGSPMVAVEVDKNTQKMVAAYSARGFSAADVSTDVVELGGDETGDHVKLFYTFNEGDRVKIAQITTRGLTHTDEKRMERDFYLFRVGDFLENEKLQNTERSLYETSAFSLVTIHSEPTGRSAGGVEEREVTIDAAEAKRFLLIYGFGFQSRNGNPTVPGLGFLHGLRALGQITDTNMFGKLDSGTLQFRVAQDELLGELSFQNPRPLGLKLPVTFSVFAQRLAEQSFKTDRYTGQVQFEHRLSQKSVIYFSYIFERINVFDLQLSSIQEIERDRQPVRLGRIGPSYLRDTRDSAFDPTTGSLTTGSFSLASVAFGGNAQYVKMLVEHDRYYRLPLTSKVIYSVSGRLGLAQPFGGNPDLPISERFFAGGSRDLRGFGFELAGPIDPVTGNPLGGDALVVLNNELRFPIYHALGGAVFSDTGNVFARIQDIRPDQITESLGFGLRINTPVGPLRVDMGFLVANKPPGTKDYRVHLSFGQTF